MVKGRKPTDIVSFTLRLKESLRLRLEREGEKRRRSINAEMIERLEQSLAADSQPRDQEQLLKAVRAAVAEELGAAISKQLEAGINAPTLSVAQVIEMFARSREQHGLPPMTPGPATSRYLAETTRTDKESEDK